MDPTTGVLHYPLSQRTLDNGLRVIISSDHATPVVAVNLWYNVGSRDESPGRTGVAHLFEHLMFQGSAEVASGEHLAILQHAGGSVNATTSFDRTNYFETVPTGALDLALWLEADRMASLDAALTADNLNTQRSVVFEERRQRYDNVPYGDVSEKIAALSFPANHPYGHTPIGSMVDLDAFSVEEAKAFFWSHYAPNNAVLTLVGDIDPVDGFNKVRKYFGKIPRRTVAQRPVTTPLPPHDGCPAMTVRGQVPTDAIYLMWRIPRFGTRQLDCLRLALAILGDGLSARIHRALVRDNQLAESAGTSMIELAGSNSTGFAVARALEGTTLDQLEAGLLEQIELMTTHGPTDEELARITAQFERAWLGRLARLSTRADEMSRFATLMGDPDIVNRRLADLGSVTATEVQDACQQYLRSEQRAILRYEALHV